MLRKDANAGFVKSGAWIFSRYRFQAAGLEARRALNEGAYRRLQRQQAEAPALLMTDEASGRAWWLFRDAVYRDDEGLSQREVMALLLQRQGQRQRRLERALALMDGAAVATPVREPIPDEVKAFVWQRDGGCCVRCGSRQRLEFDHVIPFSQGGSSSARNLQLLCEACNREKGASVV